MKRSTSNIWETEERDLVYEQYSRLYGTILEPANAELDRKAALVLFADEKAHICISPKHLVWDLDTGKWVYTGPPLFPWRTQ